MAIAATASILANTGAAILPESVVWFDSAFTGGVGDYEKHRSEWSLTLPGTQTWTAKKHRGHPTLEREVDVTTDIKLHQVPVLVEQAGTVAGTVMVRDAEGNTSTSTEVSETVAAFSGYSRLWFNSASTATDGIPFVDTFTGADGTNITARSADTNPWKQDWRIDAGSFAIDGDNRCECLTQDGSGYGVASCQTFSTKYDVSVKMRFPSGVTANRQLCGIHFRVAEASAVGNFLKFGIDQIDGTNRVRLEQRVGFVVSTLVNASFGAPSIDTDYTLYVRNDGNSIKCWVALSSVGVDPENDIPIIDTTTTTLNTATRVGFGGVEFSTLDSGTSRGPVLFDDFSVTLLDSGAGTSEADAIASSELWRQVFTAKDHNALLGEMSGTYAPTGVSQIRGTNVVWRGTSAAPFVYDLANFPTGGSAALRLGGGGTSRRITLRHCRVIDSSMVADNNIDLSNASILNTTDDSIVVSSTLYNALTTGDSAFFQSFVGSVPGGLVNGGTSNYFVIKTVTPNTIKLASSNANAIAGTAIDITSLSNGTVHSIIKNGCKRFVTTNGIVVDGCVADVDVDPAGIPAFAIGFNEATETEGTRLAFIRCNHSNYDFWRSAYTPFNVTDLAIIDCGSGSTSIERPVRVSIFGTFGLAYCGWTQLSYTGKNPLRIATATRSVTYGNRLEGEVMSIGGDGGNPAATLVFENVLQGIDPYNDGTVTQLNYYANILTDDRTRKPDATKPTGATFGSFFGFVTGSGTGGLDRGLLSHNTLVARGDMLQGGNATGGVGMHNAGIYENNIYAIVGSHNAARAVARPTGGFTPANSLNNTWPEDSQTTGDVTFAAFWGGSNRTEAAWLADSGQSGDQFVALTLDADFVPNTTRNVTVPDGVHSDFYGRIVTPGDTVWAGAVMLDAPVSGPLAITNSDGTTISQPVSATAQPNTDVRFVVRLNAVGQNLTGLTYTESGVLRLETGLLPLTLADGTSTTFAVLLRSPTLGANQAGSLTITATGGLSATVDYLLTVASPWSIRRSDGSAIPANPITGTFQQAAGGAVFQVRIDANADTLENFSYTTDGIVTLPTGPVELGPLSPGESKILNIFLDTATLGAGQTGYAEIDFDANGVAVTTIRMEFDIEVIAAVLEASRARSRSRIR